MQTDSINSTEVEATQVEVPPAEPKKKRVLSENALAKLRIARESAARANRSKKEKRDQEKAAREEQIKKSKESIILLEQIGSDSEDLEAPPGVIVVRRRRTKPKRYSEKPCTTAAVPARERACGPVPSEAKVTHALRSDHDPT